MEVSLNILSYDLLEEQGYSVQINNNMCKVKYMYDEGTSGTRIESNNDLTWGPKDVITEHNSFLENYFASIDPDTECSLVKGLEELNWNKDETQDYVDEEYISWNGTLYALR